MGKHNMENISLGWVDIAGYAQLVVDGLNGKDR